MVHKLYCNKAAKKKIHTQNICEEPRDCVLSHDSSQRHCEDPHYCTHSTGEETEAQRGMASSRRSSCEWGSGCQHAEPCHFS